ncbi:MAG: zf-HC2 domain-containing protein, partial [Candidatus Firestonebacteria bacterium]
MADKVCADINVKFPDYLDELLSEKEMTELELHIEKCPACKKELEGYNKTVQALRNLPRYTTHPNIVIRINARIEKNKKWWQKIDHKILRGAAGLIAAVVLCVVGLQFYNGSLPRPTDKEN